MACSMRSEHVQVHVIRRKSRQSTVVGGSRDVMGNQLPERYGGDVPVCKSNQGCREMCHCTNYQRSVFGAFDGWKRVRFNEVCEKRSGSEETKTSKISVYC